LSEAYDAFAERVVAEGTILDPWQDGEARLDAEPLVLPAKEYEALGRVAEDVAEVYDELCQLVDDDDDASHIRRWAGPSSSIRTRVWRNGFATCSRF